MKSKLYQYKDVAFTFAPVYRKWTFVRGDFTLIQACPGGSVTAHKVAHHVAASFARVGKMDGLATSNINRLTRTVNDQD